MTQLPLPAKATTQKPKKELSGFFAAIGAGFLLALLYVASAHTEKVAIKEFTVQMDSGDFYDGEKVKLNLTREPVCAKESWTCLLYTSPSPRDYAASRMPSSA